MSGVHRGVTLSWPEITQRNRAENAAGNYDLYIPNRTLMALIEAEYPDLVADGVMYENGDGNVYPDPYSATHIASLVYQQQGFGVQRVIEECALGGWTARAKAMRIRRKG